MIDYNIEFTKGVLFIRLCGNLNVYNEIDISSDIFQIINDVGIRYLVYNVEDLNIEGDVNLFKISDKLVKKNDGKMLLCGNSEIKDYECTLDELSALKILESC